MPLTYFIWCARGRAHIYLLCAFNSSIFTCGKKVGSTHAHCAQQHRVYNLNGTATRPYAWRSRTERNPPGNITKHNLQRTLRWWCVGASSTDQGVFLFSFCSQFVVFFFFYLAVIFVTCCRAHDFGAWDRWSCDSKHAIICAFLMIPFIRLP